MTEEKGKKDVLLGVKRLVWAARSAVRHGLAVIGNVPRIRREMIRVRELTGKGPKEGPGVLIMCYSFYGGGAERVACRVAEALARDARVYLFCTFDKGKNYLRDDSVPVICVTRFSGPDRISMAFMRLFVRLLKKELKIDAAVSFMFSMNMVNAGSGHRARIICSERNNPAKREPWNMGRIEKIYEAADAVVFQTEAVRDLFGEKVKAHAAVIPNPVDVACSRTESRHRIVNIGRLDEQKNQAMLLRAFAEFRETHPDYTLSIYGEGKLREELQALAEELGIADSAFLEGNCPDVHERIADAEFFVLSSDYEGMSNALLECMTMGFPCISTACEGSREIIRSGEDGILTPVGGQDELRDAMALLADSPELREKLGANAKKTVERFRTDAVIEQWKQVIWG